MYYIVEESSLGMSLDAEIGILLSNTTFSPSTCPIKGDSLEEIATFLSKWSLGNGQNRLELAASSIRGFIRQNFTGPPYCGVYFGSEDLSIMLKEKIFAFELNRPAAMSRNLQLLFLAKTILIDQQSILIDQFDSFNWWTFRLLSIWQSILDSPSVELKVKIEQYGNATICSDIFSNLTSHLRVEFYVEFSRSYLFYFEHEKAEKMLILAAKEAEIDINFVGILGKRTKFQQNDIAQLILEVKSGEKSDSEVQEMCQMPYNCPLDDDTLLDGIKVRDSDENSVKLNAIQQVCLLLVFEFDRITQYKDDLLAEKLNVYIDKVLTEPLCWSVQYATLLTRCLLEANSSRRMVRACIQAENLVNLFAQQDGNSVRHRYSIAVQLPPFWKVVEIHAHLLTLLGCIGEALTLYERTKNWTQMVECYRRVNKLEDAERLVRQLLAENDDPQHWCLLGDITDNRQYYDKAWLVSKGRSARAQAGLGRLLLRHNQLEEAYQCLDASVTLQPLQQGQSVWFTLGHVAWKLDRFKDAARAYHRCVGVEPDNFEAWTNLSSAYVRLGQKLRALRILQEAVRFNYDHWKVWENYLLIAVDSDQFLEAVKAYHRLVDIKDKYEDIQVLGIMTMKAKKDTTLKAEMMKLFGRITAKMTANWRIWRFYADLNEPNRDSNDMNEQEKYVRLLKRAHQAAVQEKDWSRDIEKCVELMEGVGILAGEQLKLAEMKENPDTKAQLKASVRMSIRPVIVSIKKYYHSDSGVSLTDDRLITLFEMLKQLFILATDK